MTTQRLGGLACLVIAVGSLGLGLPAMWADATAIDRIASVLADGWPYLAAAAIFGVAGTWLLYRAAAEELARLYLVLGVGSCALCVAMLVSSACSGFFAVTYNPLGVLLAAVAVLALVLGVARSLR